jgi:hypothetical protein
MARPPRRVGNGRSPSLRHDLAHHLHYYNTDRAHTGRNDQGRTPIKILVKGKVWTLTRRKRRDVSELGQPRPLWWH